jgi:molybdenum cofactor biosynthesis enzyme MoaA
MHIRWHADHLNAVGELHQRPELVLDLRPLSRGRFDEQNKRCRLGTNQKGIGLIGAVSHHPCNRQRFTSEDWWWPPRLLKDAEIDSKIPLRTGCDAAALSILTQMAPGARVDYCAPDSLFEQRAKCGKSRIGG